MTDRVGAIAACCVVGCAVLWGQTAPFRSRVDIVQVTVSVTDTNGRLIAETDPGGIVKREYLYLNDIPLVVIQ